MQKIRVAVFCGGPSSEYAVSLKTAGQVIKNLDKKKYASRLIKISKTGEWPVSLNFLKNNFDVVFIAMHGKYGEDGILQKKLETVGIKYTGSGPMASRLGMDKIKSAEIFRRVGLMVPRFIKIQNDSSFFKGGDSESRRIFFSFPMVVKPIDGGSSVGTRVVKNERDFLLAVQIAKKYSKLVMAQEYIAGREFTCGVLEIAGKPMALLPTEIIPKASGFFDYRAKYSAGASREITPARLPKSQIAELRRQALLAHRAIGCRGFSRTDFILGKDKKFYILEINTIPGLTKASLLPKAAKKSGINFKKLLDLIINSAVSS